MLRYWFWVGALTAVACKQNPSVAHHAEPTAGSAGSTSAITASPTSPLTLLAAHELPAIDGEKAVWVGDKLVVAAGVAARPGDLSDPDVVVIAYDTAGKELWRRMITGEGSQYVRDLAATEQRIRLIVSSDHSFELGADKLVVTPAAGAIGDRFELMLDGAGRPVSGKNTDSAPPGELYGSIGLPDGTFADLTPHTVGTGPDTRKPSAVLRHFDARGTTLWQTKISSDASPDLVIPPWSANTILFTTDNIPDSDLGFVVAADIAKHELHRSPRISVALSVLVPTPDGVLVLAERAPDPGTTGKPVVIRGFTDTLLPTTTKGLAVNSGYDLRFMKAASAPDGTVWLTTSDRRNHSVAMLLRVSPGNTLESEVALPAFVFAPTPVIAGRHVALTGQCAGSTNQARRLCIQFVKID